MDHQVFAQLLGNYGEFFGALAVVATLFYLSVQIRQSTLSSRSTFQFQAQTEFTRMHEQILTNPDAARILALCRRQELPEDLSPEDLEGVEAYSNATLNTYASMAIMHNNKQIDDATYELYCEDFQRFIVKKRPGMLPICREHMVSFGPWATEQKIFKPLFDEFGGPG